MNSYDLLIVGSGIFGSVFAQQATEHGLKCLIIDKRSHNAGNAYTENVHDINVHKYGPHTHIVEHKHFEFGKQDVTVISKEFPETWELGKERYYPINDISNIDKYQKYRSLFSDESKYIFGGRLAEYKYYDMHQVVSSAIHKFNKTIKP